MDTKPAFIAKYETGYGYHRVLDIPWNTAVQRAKEALMIQSSQIHNRLKRAELPLLPPQDRLAPD